MGHKSEPASTFGVGQGADDFSRGLRQRAHQRAKSQDLVAFGKLRLLRQINLLDAIAAAKVVFVIILKVRKRR
jgi:hypothetical protein